MDSTTCVFLNIEPRSSQQALNIASPADCRIERYLEPCTSRPRGNILIALEVLYTFASPRGLNLASHWGLHTVLQRIRLEYLHEICAHFSLFTRIFKVCSLKGRVGWPMLMGCGTSVWNINIRELSIEWGALQLQPLHCLHSGPGCLHGFALQKLFRQIYQYFAPVQRHKKWCKPEESVDIYISLQTFFFAGK